MTNILIESRSEIISIAVNFTAAISITSSFSSLPVPLPPSVLLPVSLSLPPSVSLPLPFSLLSPLSLPPWLAVKNEISSVLSRPNLFQFGLILSNGILCSAISQKLIVYTDSLQTSTLKEKVKVKRPKSNWSSEVNVAFLQSCLWSSVECIFFCITWRSAVLGFVNFDQLLT